LFSFRQLTFNPNNVNELRNKLRLVAFCIRLILQSRVIDCELLHRNTIFDNVIHIVSHCVSLYFIVVQFEIFEINSVPLGSGDNQILN